MGKLLNRLAKHIRFKPKKRQIDESEGMILSAALERAAKQNNAADPLHFLDYLRKMRRGYDPDMDGPSSLMKLVDAINKFEREELARQNGPQAKP